MAKMTREERKAWAERDLKEKQAREWKDTVERARAKQVVADASELRTVKALEGNFEMGYAVWREASDLAQAERDLRQRLEWTRREVDEQTRYLDEGRIYSSTNLAMRGAEVAETMTKVRMLRESLACLTYALGIYYAPLHTAQANQLRADMLNTTVEFRQVASFNRGTGEAVRFGEAWRLVRSDDGRVFCSTPAGGFEYLLQSEIADAGASPVAYEGDVLAWLSHKAQFGR